MNNNIIQLLDISEETYTNMFIDFGTEYCNHYTAGDLFGAERLKSSKYFWAWWQNQYLTIDRAFIKKYSNTPHSCGFLLRKYEQMHSPKFLNIYPSDYVISTSFGGIVHGKREKVC